MTNVFAPARGDAPPVERARTSSHWNRTEQVRTLIVDDSPAVRRSLVSLLNSCDLFDVAGTAGNGREAIARVGELGPDLVLMDLQMPSMGGLDAIAVLRRTHPRLRIIVVSMHDGQYVRAVCKHVGAHGFIAKASSRVQMLDEIRRVIRDSRA